ncbi:MAG TPA: anthranilate synthase component I family protein [Myxococcaceae bacterium]|nr:anthranilate synthase component I family protein [Myxococcaceae bacterium]
MRDTRMSLASFERLAARGNLVPVWRELPGDTETPVSAFLKLPTPSHAFLLESVQGGERWGRYSFLGDEPIALVRQGADGVVIEPAGSRTFEDQPPPLDALREMLEPFEFARPDDAPPFVGGLVGYLGHGAVRWFEPRVPQRHGPDPDFPDGEWMLVDRCAVFDNLSHRLRIWASVHLPLHPSVEAAYGAAMERADVLAEALRRPLPQPGPAPTLGGLEDGWERAGFEAAVARAREYIAAGDCYQVVLSRRLSADYEGDPFELYRALRRVSPTPYLFFLRFGPRALAGASPELLVRLSGETVTVRPIAGTRRRGSTPQEDAALEAELKADPKEKAEHVMLVDLGRNNVGRVSRPGTVKVEEREVIERYSHVMHMVSQVSGTLDPGLDAWDVVAAAFPAGTVSGAPKVRALEIIDALEPVSRGPYAGAAGYVGFDGDMDLAIVIRSVALSGRRLRFQAGAGIVHDSVPAAEYQETAHKLRAALVAIAGDEAGQ